MEALSRELMIAAILATATVDKTGTDATHIVNQFVKVLQKLREAGEISNPHEVKRH